MAQVNERSVGVTREVYDGIMAVRQSGRTNMFYIGNVQRVAAELGYEATVAWLESQLEFRSYGLKAILDAPYPKGLVSGFHVVEEENRE